MNISVNGDRIQEGHDSFSISIPFNKGFETIHVRVTFSQEGISIERGEDELESYDEITWEELLDV